jgi:hypothetical protein
MKPRLRFSFLLGPPLLCLAPVYAQEGPQPPPAPPAETAPAPRMGEPEEPPLTPAEIRAIREELARVRKEAAEERRRNEERIRALEDKVENLQKPPAPSPAGTRPGPGGTGQPPTSSQPGGAVPGKVPPGGTPPSGNPITTRPGFRARLYGFARADMDLDSRKMFAGPHLPFWVLSPDDPRAADRTDGSFTIHPRLTRLGLDSEAPAVTALGDARLTGKIEIDFFNILPDRNSATSNSRQFVRMRHAYARLDWKNSHALLGQYWDLISPLFPAANYDVVMWNAGNLGDRRPQFRYVWEPRVRQGKVSVAAAVGSPSAIDSQDLDADQIVDGEESSRPTAQFRVALNQRSWVEKETWEVGFWGHDGELRVNRASAIMNRRTFHSHALGGDLRVPITRKLLFQGEGWFGKALADVRGGAGQNLNTISGEEVHSKGGWAELLYAFNKTYTLGGGFTIDDPTDRDVTPFTGMNQTAVGRTLNRSYYVINRLNLGGGMVVGIDWMLFHTDFRRLSSGENNRWNLWFQHNF